MSKMIFESSDTYVYNFHSNWELVWSDLGRNGKLILYVMLGKCMEFQEKKRFFKKFQQFLFLWEWFKCYFWIPHPKTNKGTNFHENAVNETWNMNKRWLPRGRKRGIVVQFFDPNILEIIWDRCLKFGTFTYP